MSDFVKPAELFKLKRKSLSQPQQSPMRCLNNLTSPEKKPSLLSNPFHPVKRRLNLGSPNKSSPRKSPNKRTRMMQMDEDANLEPPKPKRQHRSEGCYKNDWKLRTKLKINFRQQCKNWTDNSSTTHKRHLDDESPSKFDKTISVEAIKNAATIYQQPYLPWLPLYPRKSSELKVENFKLTKNSLAVTMMHKDWCESLDDLVNLLIDGRCPFFYLCSDNYNVLFRSKSQIEAFLSPFPYGMSLELRKLGIKVNCDEDSGIENDSSLDDEILDDVQDDENSASQFLESIGLSQNEVHFESKRKGFLEADSNSQSTKSTSSRPFAAIEGADDIRRFVKFLQSNKTYTINTIGDFANIPPTLLAPREFRLSTPQYPTVSQTSCSSQATSSPKLGPISIELRGTILPNLYKKLHKLLTISENLDHACSSTHLEISEPFESIQFT